ncbi:type I-E CRISPR-associated protein Cas5/CasD [Streptomyces hainanensis]|uniref:Type I-E CRISPR-associated protein Cas5/CasD n=1 Tax=Streptomyces hainanensis TaxID=402648 RepID=A0A4R4TK23_9ACTN|nr:type I-E CRISPR-associated protein Cas5/CasD [Streptomyces hainanensis]TDC78268.1 type I-E CRISPR-associated protein Cas5/CasD [Streptomyces hainanensis]
MNGFLLHLSAPMQSWGEHSAFTDRDSAAHPTRSGLIGMIAAALGITRADAVTDPVDGMVTHFGRLSRLRFTIRHDRIGTRMRDYHTVGGGYPPHRTAPTASGGRRKAGQGTIVSHRHYLADAAFTVAVTAPTDVDLLPECVQALETPRWPLHLGRRSCPPGALLVLGRDRPNPVADLLRLPLARPKPRSAKKDTEVTVKFTSDAPFGSDIPPTESSRAAVTTLNDEPVRLKPQDRVYRSRPSYTTSCTLPVDLCGGYGIDYLQAIDAYFNPSTPERTEP